MNSSISRNYTARSTSKHVEPRSNSKSSSKSKSNSSSKSNSNSESITYPVLQPESDMIDSTVSKKCKKINYNKRGLPNRERRTWVEESRQYDFSEPSEHYQVPNYETLICECMTHELNAKIKELETMPCTCNVDTDSDSGSSWYDDVLWSCYKHHFEYEYKHHLISLCDVYRYSQASQDSQYMNNLYDLRDYTSYTKTYSSSEYNTKGAKRDSSTWRRVASKKRISRINAKKTQSENQCSRIAMDFYIA
jgi:hypothetical protein